MKALGLTLAAIALVLVFALGGLIFGYIGFSNDANGFEADIPAQYTQMQNVYDNGWKKVVETAQVPAMQMDNYKSVYDGVMKGRYGADGSKALLQFIKEQNPTLDPALYTKLQTTIDSFHTQFEATQQNIIARKQGYNRFLTATTEGRFYNMIGHYPHIHVGIPVGSQDDYQIVTSDKTQTDFQNHKSDPLNLRSLGSAQPTQK